jgi:hypothetical protein
MIIPMRKSITTSDKYAELNRLRAEYTQALANGLEMLRHFGMESPQFLAANQATGKIYRRIGELQGKRDQPWKA